MKKIVDSSNFIESLSWIGNSVVAAHPHRLSNLQAIRTAWKQDSEFGYFILPGEGVFRGTPSESIEYPVMKHASGAGLIFNVVWSDLGACDAVWSVLPKHVSGNDFLGDVLFTNSRNTLQPRSSKL